MQNELASSKMFTSLDEVLSIQVQDPTDVVKHVTSPKFEKEKFVLGLK